MIILHWYIYRGNCSCPWFACCVYHVSSTAASSSAITILPLPLITLQAPAMPLAPVITGPAIITPGIAGPRTTQTRIRRKQASLLFPLPPSCLPLPFLPSTIRPSLVQPLPSVSPPLPQPSALYTVAAANAPGSTKSASVQSLVAPAPAAPMLAAGPQSAESVNGLIHATVSSVSLTEESLLRIFEQKARSKSNPRVAAPVRDVCALVVVQT